MDRPNHLARFEGESFQDSSHHSGANLAEIGDGRSDRTDNAQERLPREHRAQHPENAVQDGTSIPPWSSTFILPMRRFRNEAVESCALVVCQVCAMKGHCIFGEGSFNKIAELW